MHASLGGFPTNKDCTGIHNMRYPYHELLGKSPCRHASHQGSHRRACNLSMVPLRTRALSEKPSPGWWHLWQLTAGRIKFFPNSVSLGSSAIVKVPSEQPKSGLPKFPGSQERFQERFPSQVPKQGSQRFPSKVPKQGPQARFKVPKSKIPKQGSQERFPGEVPKQGSLGRGSQRFPKIPKSRFPSQVPKQGQRFPGTGSQRFPKVPKTFAKRGSQEQVPKNISIFQRFPRTGYPRFPSKVPKSMFPRACSQARFISKVPKPG